VISHEWGNDREVFTSHGGDRTSFEVMIST
jgi:hypothetical protein